MLNKNGKNSADMEALAVCKRIQYLIDRNGMSYGQLAKMTGIPKSAVHRYANGETLKIPMDRIELMANAFGVSAAWLMGWSDEEENKPPEGGKSELIDMIIRELAALPTDKQQDVLRYIRFLRNG